MRSNTRMRPSSRDGSAAVFNEISAEVRGVALGLEADEVEGAEPAGEPLVLRQRGEDLGRREGDVQEEAHVPVPAGLPHLLAHQQEMVVVHPDGVVLAGELREQPGEAAVDLLVGLELGFVEMGEVDAVVEDRPERAVGVAEIVALVFGLRSGRRGRSRRCLRRRAGRRGSRARRVSPDQPNQTPPPRSASASARATASPPALRRARAGDAVGGDYQAARHDGTRPHACRDDKMRTRPCSSGSARQAAQRAAAGTSRASARMAVSTATWRWML